MIFNMVGGGGGSGATLVVSSPANVSVTVSKDDKSYTKNSGSLGSATFKGLATGTWTVTISGNGQTATKTIEITADYAITIAFFSATINITYPANSTCVVTNSGGQTVASDTNTDSSAKTWTATVGATGTYTVTATATDGSGKTKSTTVSITADGQSESVTLMYGLYLYNAGDQCTAVTGGWSSEGYSNTGVIAAEPTYDETKISFSGVDGQHVVACTVNPIDLTDFDRIVFFGAVTATATYNGNEFGLVLEISKTKNFANFASMKTMLKGTYTESNGGLSITDLTGEYYVAVYADGLYGISGYMTQLLLE